MARPRVLILRAPGTNCDRETAFAFEQAGAVVTRLHVNRLSENPDQTREFQILCIPGGFSYGDDIAAGRILAGQLQLHLVDQLRAFQQEKKLILGICNGFQVLLKSGLLIPPDHQGPRATLAWNDSGRFEDRWVHLRANNSNCVFLRDSEQLFLPIAHAEGRFVARDVTVLDAMTNNGRVALRYCNQEGESPRGFPENPNGSQGNVAGVCDESGRVFGLMPHPERYLFATNHPSWTRTPSLPAEGDGCAIFRNAVSYFG